MPARERKFTFVLTDEEKERLEAVAQDENRSAANWLRSVIADAYEKKFGDKSPKKKR
jgi:predicted DNA-binding protein